MVSFIGEGNWSTLRNHQPAARNINIKMPVIWSQHLKKWIYPKEKIIINVANSLYFIDLMPMKYLDFQVIWLKPFISPFCHWTKVDTIENIIEHTTNEKLVLFFKCIFYHKQKCKIYVINSITTVQCILNIENKSLLTKHRQSTCKN